MSVMVIGLIGCNNGVTGQSVHASNSVDQGVSTIKWGFIGPLTGTAALYGTAALNAERIAIEEINAKGGVGGKQIELFEEDGKCDGPTAVSAAQKLINVNNVSLIFGGHCSSESLAIIPVTQQYGVFQMAGITSSPSYTGKGRFAFRISPSSAFYTAAQADVAISKGIKVISVLHEQREFPVGIVGAFRKRFEELGGKVCAVEAFNPGETDFRTQLEKITACKPEAILLATQGPDSASLMLKQIKELQIRIPLMGDPNVVSEVTWAKSNGSLPPDAWSVVPHAEDDENPVTLHFVEEYNRRFGPMGFELTFGAQDYDSVNIMAEAFGLCGANNECLRGFLLGIKNRESAVGRLSYQPDGDPIFGLAVTRIVDGKAVYETIK